MTTTSISLPGVTRHYTSLNQIIEDVDFARIYAGFHYRSTLVRSNTLGRAIANWMNANMMTPLAELPVSLVDEDNDGHYHGIPVQEIYDLNNLENEDYKPVAELNEPGATVEGEGTETRTRIT